MAALHIQSDDYVILIFRYASSLISADILHDFVVETLLKNPVEYNLIIVCNLAGAVKTLKVIFGLRFCQFVSVHLFFIKSVTQTVLFSLCY